MAYSRVTSRGQVTIPQDIREALGIREGDTVRFEIEDGKIQLELERPTSVFAKYRGKYAEGKKTIGQVLEEIRELRGRGEE